MSLKYLVWRTKTTRLKEPECRKSSQSLLLQDNRSQQNTYKLLECLSRTEERSSEESKERFCCRSVTPSWWSSLFALWASEDHPAIFSILCMIAQVLYIIRNYFIDISPFIATMFGSTLDLRAVQPLGLILQAVSRLDSLSQNES